MSKDSLTIRGAVSDSHPDSQLHIPGAPFRPGDEPRFRKFREQPGDLPRPDTLAPLGELHEHAYSMVRVLDDDGHALGPWNPELPVSELRRALELMVRIRYLDTRLMTMQRQGKLSFYLESKGEEAVAVGAGLALQPEDLLFPYYRQQALMLVRGAALVDMICQCIGNSRDNVKGRQMPVHYSFKQGKLVTISSPVATQFPQAVGAAMAFAYRSEPKVAVGWIGDGASSEGDFHYAITFASVYRPPVILNIVNNQWAISTHCSMASGGKSFAARGLAFGLPCLRVDGNDLLAVYAVTAWAAERARRGGGPSLIELVTYRASAHSSSDDPSRYRPSDEARVWPGGDPVRRLADHLILLGAWSLDQQRDLEKRIEGEVALACKEAESFGTMARGPHPPLASMFEDVYETPPWHLVAQRAELGA